MKPYIKHILLTMFLALPVLLNSCSKDGTSPSSKDIIINGNVEAGANQPDGWLNSNGNGNYQTTWTSQESFSPNKSLEISTQNAVSPDFAFWTETINTGLPIGKNIVAKVKVKGNLEGAGISIAIRADDTATPNGGAEQFITTQGTTPISGTFDWTEYSIELVNLGSSMKSVTIYLVYLPKTTGSVYFDNVSLSY